ncbi:MAG TPA: hypothetical protein VE175_07875, partial [Woeseiaceae bacterium]|nr:hypothetical protein [Woeseiaceae bacterium]
TMPACFPVESITRTRGASISSLRLMRLGAAIDESSLQKKRFRNSALHVACAVSGPQKHKRPGIATALGGRHRRRISRGREF